MGKPKARVQSAFVLTIFYPENNKWGEWSILFFSFVFLFCCKRLIMFSYLFRSFFGKTMEKGPLSFVFFFKKSQQIPAAAGRLLLFCIYFNRS